MPSEQASIALLGALSKLLAEVSAVPLRLDVPGVECRPQAPERGRRPALRLRDPAAGAARRTAADRRRRVHGRRKVHPRQLDLRRAHHRERRPEAHHPVAGAGAPPRRRRVVPARPHPARPSAHRRPHERRLRPARGDVRSASRAGSPSSTPPTSTPSTRATASSPRSCWPRATCGCSSRPRRATPTRCRGTTCARPPSAARPWPSCSTAPHADAVLEVRGHLARMMTSRGLSDSPLFTVPESGTDTEGLLPPEAVAPIVGWLHDLAADPHARRGRGVPDARRRGAPQRAAHPRHRRRPRRADRGRRATSTARPRRSTPRPRRSSPASRPTARC